MGIFVPNVSLTYGHICARCIVNIRAFFGPEGVANLSQNRDIVDEPNIYINLLPIWILAHTRVFDETIFKDLDIMRKISKYVRR